MERDVQDDNRYSVREITNGLNNYLENPVSIRTVTRYVHECGYEYKTKTTKPFLTKNHQRYRLNWYLECSNWTVDQWKNVIFCDESTFHIIKRKNQVKIRRTRDQRWEGGFHVSRVNFWSAVTSKGSGCLRMYNENTNSNVFCDIIDNYLIATVQLCGMEDNYLLQHDNARYYVPKQTQVKLREVNAHVLDWPAKSPDLKTVEHLWSIVDNKLKYRKMSSVEELTKALASEWLSIESKLCEKLIFPMPQRKNKCLAVNSKSIDY